MVRKVLIVGSDFAPSAIIGAKRPTKLARDLSSYGWKPYVLTMPDPCLGKLDPSHSAPPPEVAPIVRIPCNSFWLHSIRRDRSKRGLARLGALLVRIGARLTRNLVPIDESFPWTLAATSVGVEIVRKEKVDLIWATAPPRSSTYLAHRISMQTGVPYILDFRDVTTCPPESSRSFYLKRSLRYEERALKDAAGITHVAPKQFEALERLFPIVEKIPHQLITNWFEWDQVDATEAHTFDRPTIFHGGSLYGGMRDIGGFLQGLAIASHQVDLQFLNCGPATGEAGYVLPQAKRYSVADRVFTREILPHTTFLSYCKGADIQLLVIGHTQGLQEHAAAIPGKLYDYLSTCRPILVIGPKGCEAGNLVTSLNRGIFVEDDQPGRIAEAILKLIDKKGADGDLDLTRKRVEAFEASHCIDQMAQFFLSICLSPP